jgi:hypothetical protein
VIGRSINSAALIEQSHETKGLTRPPASPQPTTIHQLDKLHRVVFTISPGAFARLMDAVAERSGDTAFLQ